MNGKLIAGKRMESETPVTLPTSIDTPVTPPSMKLLESRNPLRPMPADTIPRPIKPALSSSRARRFIHTTRTRWSSTLNRVPKTRLEAFSDGVIAILITIMVLELRPPTQPTFAALRGVGSQLFVYVLSFVSLGIYWNNHHHMLHAATRVNGAILWANLHLLFWLSLMPFVTEWMGHDLRAPLPTAVYACVVLLSAIAYRMLQARIIRLHGP